MGSSLAQEPCPAKDLRALVVSYRRPSVRLRRDAQPESAPACLLSGGRPCHAGIELTLGNHNTFSPDINRQRPSFLEPSRPETRGYPGQGLTRSAPHPAHPRTASARPFRESLWASCFLKRSPSAPAPVASNIQRTEHDDRTPDSQPRESLPTAGDNNRHLLGKFAISAQCPSFAHDYPSRKLPSLWVRRGHLASTRQVAMWRRPAGITYSGPRRTPLHPWQWHHFRYSL